MSHLSKFNNIILLALLLASPLSTVNAQIVPSNAKEVQNYISKRENLYQSSLVKSYPVKSVGPVVMAGRVTDIAVNPDNVNEFYIAYASGGIFKTTNNGASFKPVFDGNGTLTMGDIAISKANPNIIWAGTGEVNSSRSSYAGTGVYKSMNGGKTWTFEGLTNTQHISRILTHPTNPNIAWVASEGPLYSNSDARGVYKTVNGGKTWKKTLFINDSTGVIDLIMNPRNPNQLWAATWTRKRYAWNFEGSGTQSTIYESNDGGDTWHKSNSGFLTGPNVGRIGLTICQSHPNVLYAIVDNQTKIKKTKKKEKKTEPQKLTFSSFKNMSVDELLKLDDKKLNTFLRSNGFPSKYTAEKVKQDIKAGKYTPKDIADYNGEDAATAEVSSDVIGAEVFRSNDYGKHWHKVNNYLLKGVYYTYGYYFAQIRVNPSNPNEIFIMGVPILRSEDGGHTYTLVGENVHSDNHAFWFDKNNPKHVMVGTDGGVYVSYDSGDNWTHLNNMAVGQFYSVAVDNAKPFNIYGGLQDNGVFYGSSKTIPNKSPHWKRLLGGDGMHVAVDPRDNGIVYAGFQFGNYFRINTKTGSHTYITPKHNIGEPAYRWNWNTPILISPHNPDIIYMGSQKLLRSMDQGQHFKVISPDLTTDKQPQGNVPYSTITTISESPITFGEIWVGTDDGNVQLTRDGGVHWELVSKNLPQKYWVSSVFASPYEAGTAFVSLTGYRYDKFKAMLYETTDYGKTWKSISGDLPQENINVIVQDPVNSDLLYVGTDDGAYLSLNGGENWQPFGSEMPNVPTYDIVVQKPDSALVLGTHGRSVYTMNIAPFEELTGNKLDTPVVAYKPNPIIYSKEWGKAPYPYMKPRTPSVTLLYFVGYKTNRNRKVEITISKKDGKVLNRLTGPSDTGFHTFKYDLKVDKRASRDQKPEFLAPGTYTVIFKKGSFITKTKLIVKSHNNSNDEEISGDID